MHDPAILEAVNGFIIGTSYHEAVAAEIAMSKKIQALGLRIKQVGLLPFTCVEHAQWVHTGRWHLPPLKKYRRMIRACLWSVAPEFLKEQFDYLMMSLGKSYRQPSTDAIEHSR